MNMNSMICGQAFKILIWFHLQGFTAAQLSTEPVGKILAEEPAAGGIDIGSVSNYPNIGIGWFLPIQNINCWRQARQETWSWWRRLSTCIRTLSTAETLMVSCHHHIKSLINLSFISQEEVILQSADSDKIIHHATQSQKQGPWW